VRLTKQNSDGWRVVWEPAIVQSELHAGDKLACAGWRRSGPPSWTRRQADRDPAPVVTVGVSPEKITDWRAAKDAGQAFKKIDVSVDMPSLSDRVENADRARSSSSSRCGGPTTTRSATTSPLAGTVFREERDLAPTRAFARALLGTADAATREDIDANPETVAQGDIVGHGGLQQRYDTTLRGTAGQSVVIAREAPDDNGRGHADLQHRAGRRQADQDTLDVADAERGRRAVAARSSPARWSPSRSATRACSRSPTARTAARSTPR
jgi:hypothetical protein